LLFHRNVQNLDLGRNGSKNFILPDYHLYDYNASGIKSQSFLHNSYCNPSFSTKLSSCEGNIYALCAQKGKKRKGDGGEEKTPGRGGKFPFQVDFTGQKGYNLSKKKATQTGGKA
jgi:hypothetical protein